MKKIRKKKKKMEEDNGNHQPFCCFSYARCGTHLLSDVVQAITGLTNYWPRETSLLLEIFNKVPKNAFFLNHSFPNLECFSFFSANRYKIIINFRDPRDQLISHYYHSTELEKGGDNEWGHFLRKFNKEEAINILITTLEAGGFACPVRQTQWVHGWLDAVKLGIPTLLVTYEGLVQNKAKTVVQIANFLGYNLCPDKVEEVVKETSFDQPSHTIKHRGEHENEIKRKGIVGEWRNHFTQSNKDTFKSVGGKFLIELGYEKDLDW